MSRYTILSFYLHPRARLGKSPTVRNWYNVHDCCGCNLNSSLVVPVGRPTLLGNTRQTPFDDRQCSLQQHRVQFSATLRHGTGGKRSRVIRPLLLLLPPFYSCRRGTNTGNSNSNRKKMGRRVTVVECPLCLRRHCCLYSGAPSYCIYPVTRPGPIADSKAHRGLVR